MVFKYKLNCECLGLGQCVEQGLDLGQGDVEYCFKTEEAVCRVRQEQCRVDLWT